jgi:hypothetical protein
MLAQVQCGAGIPIARCKRRCRVLGCCPANTETYHPPAKVASFKPGGGSRGASWHPCCAVAAEPKIVSKMPMDRTLGPLCTPALDTADLNSSTSTQMTRSMHWVSEVNMDHTQDPAMQQRMEDAHRNTDPRARAAGMLTLLSIESPWKLRFTQNEPRKPSATVTLQLLPELAGSAGRACGPLFAGCTPLL